VTRQVHADLVKIMEIGRYGTIGNTVRVLVDDRLQAEAKKPKNRS